MTIRATNVTIHLHTLKCWVCGCSFGVDSDVYAVKRRENTTLYCPNGCRLGFGTSEADRVREELAKVRREKEYVEAKLSSARQKTDAVERKLSATKGVVTRIKNRVSKGVCPCCNRTFVNLQRHMASKHPDFDKSEE